jgi:hypothetical protein
MSQIFSNLDPQYIAKRNLMGSGKYNGAYYYSQEIVANIIPNVKTNRNWVTINIPGCGFDNSIVFIHSGIDPIGPYMWLRNYANLVLVCFKPEMVEACQRFGKAIYLPLSVDVEYVKKFKYDGEMDPRPCYVGNKWGYKANDLAKYLPDDCVQYSNMPREDILANMARHSGKVYAVGRCAIEALVLGKELGMCDSRFPDTSVWKILDNRDAAKMLQEELDKIDGKC